MPNSKLLVENDFAGRQAQGTREKQEDSYSFSIVKDSARSHLVAIVCDGIGGHAYGEQASSIAVNAFMNRFHESSHKHTPIDIILEQSVIFANDQIRQQITDNPKFEGMGTTLLAFSLNMEKQAVHWINVGDCQLYQYSDNILHEMNNPHTWMHEGKSRLYSALMGENIEHIDKGNFLTKSGDKILLSSDGLLTLPSKHIKDILSSHHEKASNYADLLLRSVLDCAKSKQDNTTTVLYLNR